MPDPASYLLDTNIVLALLRDNALGKAVDQAYGLSGSLNRNLVSVVTVGELLSFASRARWGPAKCASLEAALQELVWIDINDRSVLDAYAVIDSLSVSGGRTMGKNDVWIAASAAVTGAVLLTTDRDFDHLHQQHIQRILIDPKMGQAP
jgi:tRNA(fMet)-specific endonuclease VapC